ncbi:MAG TPA: hypothetical protein VNW89_14245 [Stellaceae bacterium]|jgi:hypothetical protein|nr:hypothetical protein [Stellaceae bacterium]
MTEVASAWLYLGCAALLIAAVMLPLSAKMRAGLFTAVIIAAIAGGQSQPIDQVATEIIALN